MKKKGIIVLMLAGMLILWTGACGDESSSSGPTSDGLANSGARLIFTITQASVYVDIAEGNTVVAIDQTMDVKFELVGTNPDEDPDTGLFVESYVVDYLSSDPDAVPLDPLFVGFTAYIPPRGSLTMRGMLLMAADTILDYAAQANLDRESVYEARISFYGHNQYGYEFTAVYSIFITLANY